MAKKETHQTLYASSYKNTAPPIVLSKGSKLNLITALEPAANFQEIERLDEQHEYNHQNPNYEKLDMSNDPGFSTGEFKKKERERGETCKLRDLMEIHFFKWGR